MTVSSIPSAADHHDSAVALRTPSHDRDPAKGMLAGFVGGLVGSLLMMQFQDRLGARFDREASGPNGESGSDTRAAEQEGIERVAAAISQRVLGRDLAPASALGAARAVRLAYGALAGGIYGATAEDAPEVTHGNGLPFGHAAWALADDMSGAGSPGPDGEPGEFRAGISSLMSRFVYGLATESVRRAVRARL